MTYTVYATMPNGKKLFYGKKLNSVSDVNEGIYACEGSERDRYVNVVLDLKSGKDVARDEWY